MIVLGVKGHAKDLLAVLQSNGYKGRLVFYDDVSEGLPKRLYDKYQIIRSKEEAISYMQAGEGFCLGVGNPLVREKLTVMFAAHGPLLSIFCRQAIIGEEKVVLGEGINVMPHVFISNSVTIGKGSLINTAASIHHDSVIGPYCEIMPGARILGAAVIGEKSRIGTGAMILPGVKVGERVMVGAGAVVSKDLPNGVVAVGVPARILKQS